MKTNLEHRQGLTEAISLAQHDIYPGEDDSDEWFHHIHVLTFNYDGILYNIIIERSQGNGGEPALKGILAHASTRPGERLTKTAITRIRLSDCYRRIGEHISPAYWLDQAQREQAGKAGGHG